MKFLNYGSLNKDKVYTVPHFVTAGETLASLGYAEYSGGKGLNQSIALARAGADVHHAGKIGQDGHSLKEELSRAGIKVKGISEKGMITGHAIIQINEHGENCILLYGGANREITESEIDKVLAEFGEGDVLVLQNEINHLDYLIESAYRKRFAVVLNPSPMDESVNKIDLSKMHYLILNEVEGREITGHGEPKDILDQLINDYPTLKVVLTLGAAGSVYRDATQEFRQDIFPVEVVDTTAAGDTFLGYFLAHVFKNGKVPDALRIASKAASIAVSRKGAAKSIPTIDEVLS
ncbi:ribokinase [Bacillus tianshenii]|uniref:Ribokinase n=1 Tax=Sutcliffiella tianshenii TaxID=1463404 RepID=A0ABS2P2R1_9BACI|nr:ribokinase [Bacillus tianshenii]MBM7621154.1 ribokinase [Bacillus tianshenii]